MRTLILLMLILSLVGCREKGDSARNSRQDDCQSIFVPKNGNDPSPVPEPMTIILFGAGMGWMVRNRLKKKKGSSL